jgi:glycosyltransferase involved in cell wall biosynthesis
VLGGQANLELWSRIQCSRSRFAFPPISTLNDEQSAIQFDPIAQASTTSGTHGRRRFRLAILASHVIQYQSPLFRVLAGQPEIDLSVFFCSEGGAQSYHDKGFGREVKWDVPLLEGYSFEFLPNWSIRPDASRFWGRINPRIILFLRRRKFDAIWIHGWARFTDWMAMLAAFTFKVPVLMRGESNLLPALPPWKSALKRIVLRNLFRRTSAFLAIGRYNADFYRAYGVPKEKIYLIPYAVNNDFFLSQADKLASSKAELKQELGIAPDLPVVLYSGKLIKKKRPSDLLRAFEYVSKAQKAVLVYVGAGSLEPDLKQYAETKHLPVVFAGFRNQTELPKWFAIADVFALPSGEEPWGLVVNEAMCFSLPVVASDQVGATGDLVRGGVNGFVFPTGDARSLSEHLQLLLSDPVLRARFGQKSREIIEHWSYRENVNGILSCLEHLANAKQQA